MTTVTPGPAELDQLEEPAICDAEAHNDYSIPTNMSAIDKAVSPSREQPDASLTVNEVANAFPKTLGVFKSFGIDSCCGGNLPLSVVAERHGIELQVLLDALGGVVKTDR